MNTHSVFNETLALIRDGVAETIKRERVRHHEDRLFAAVKEMGEAIKAFNMESKVSGINEGAWEDFKHDWLPSQDFLDEMNAAQRSGL